MNPFQLAQLSQQKHLLDSDLLRRMVAMSLAMMMTMLYLPPLVSMGLLGTCVAADLGLMHALSGLIARPNSRFWLGRVMISAFVTMSSYLCAAALLWITPDTTAKIGALVMIFGGMLSILLVRTVFAPLTIANSAPVLMVAAFIGMNPLPDASQIDHLFLSAGGVLILGYFILTLRSYLRAQRELGMARDAALERAETQGRFLATMSHELRTPLNGILGLSQAMITDHPGIGAEVIRDSAREMAHMVADLLDNAAIDAGALRIDPRPIDPADEMRRFAAKWQGRFSAQGLHLILDLSPELPRRVLADPLRLAQCLSNLLSNALRVTDHGGVTLAVKLAADGLLLSVTDTGPGLAPGAEIGLFQPFGHSAANAAQARRGVGLGLSIARGLARAMGGDLVHERPIVGGAAFHLTIRAPLAPVAELPPATAPGPAVTRSLQGRKVLVVDDIATNRLVLKLLLAQHGVAVTEAASGPEALAILTAMPAPGPDAVLMDIRMPGLSGTDCLPHLRAAGYTHPVIAISADADPAHQSSAIAMGFDAYLTKPIEDADLFATLARLLPAGPPAPAGL